MKIILAIDSFKGSLSSKEAEDAVAQGIQDIIPDCRIEAIPIADGGEGTLSVLLESTDGVYHKVQAHNPCMELITAQYGISKDGNTAFIEMANISGLPLIRENQRNPMKTTTFGTGEIIKAALEKGCTEFILGIGGSATNDAGTGLLQALGYRFLDEHGEPLEKGGEILEKIKDIDCSQRHPLLKNAHFIVACDVRNPFSGPEGAAYVYARQKGADNNMIVLLDEGMQSYAQVIKEQTGKDITCIPGSGAAGGLGGGILPFLHAELKSGADLILEHCRFKERIIGADLIITGEGKIDRQSLMGKIPGKILQATKEENIPVIAIAGKAEDKELLMEAGFKGIYQTKPDSMPLEEAMEPGTAKRNIQKTVSAILSSFINSD